MKNTQDFLDQLDKLTFVSEEGKTLHTAQGFQVSYSIDFIDKGYLEEFWDNKRGLSLLQKNVTKFIRTSNKNNNEIEYIQNIGNTSTKMQGFELYFFQEKTGISIFFSFPVEKKEEQIEIWNSFKNSIFYRGIQYSDEKFSKYIEDLLTDYNVSIENLYCKGIEKYEPEKTLHLKILCDSLINRKKIIGTITKFNENM
jgi:hypothetical protein